MYGSCCEFSDGGRANAFASTMPPSCCCCCCGAGDSGNCCWSCGDCGVCGENGLCAMRCCCCCCCCGPPRAICICTGRCICGCWNGLPPPATGDIRLPPIGCCCCCCCTTPPGLTMMRPPLTGAPGAANGLLAPLGPRELGEGLAIGPAIGSGQVLVEICSCVLGSE